MVLDEFSLEGKIAIVTGASRGLGKAISVCLAEAGCNVVVASRSLKDLEQTASEINQKGTLGVPIETDVRDWKQVERMVDAAIERFGKVDILVNNAGMVIEKPFLEFSEEEWRNLMDTDLTGMFFCCKAVGKYMVKQGGGKIINMSSAFGIKVPANVVAYSAAKGAVLLFTRALAVEWGKYKINVNCIAPGHFYTAFIDKILENPKLLNVILRKIPLGRYAQPHELGALVVFLASKASDFITGEMVVIDGGLTVKL